MSDIELCSLHCQLYKIQAVSHYSIKAFEISVKEMLGTKQLGGIFLMHAFLDSPCPSQDQIYYLFPQKSARRLLW